MPKRQMLTICQKWLFSCRNYRYPKWIAPIPRRGRSNLRKSSFTACTYFIISLMMFMGFPVSLRMKNLRQLVVRMKNRSHSCICCLTFVSFSGSRRRLRWQERCRNCKESGLRIFPVSGIRSSWKENKEDRLHVWDNGRKFQCPSASDSRLWYLPDQKKMEDWWLYIRRYFLLIWS